MSTGTVFGTSFSLLPKQNSSIFGVESTHDLPSDMKNMVIKEKFKNKRLYIPEPSYMKFTQSRYDLPLEQNRNIVRQWLNNLPSNRSSRYTFGPDMLRRLTRAQRTTLRASTLNKSRFSSLNPKILLDRLSTRPQYSFVRNMAMEKLDCEVMRQFQLIQRNFTCSSQLFTADELPHRVFSWTRDDFLKRRKLTDFLWMDLLTHQGAECLSKQKLQFDMLELFRFVKKLFSSNDDDIYDFMEDAHHFLSFHKDLKKELDKNKAKFREDLNMSLATNFSRRDELENQTKRQLAQTLMDFNIISPIQMRYHVNYIENGVQQFKIKVEGAEDKLEKQTEFLKDQMKFGQKAFHDTINMYYAQAQDYKLQISEFTIKYDTDLDTIDNKNTALKNSIEKLVARRKYFEEHIVVFHKDIEKLRLKDIAAKEAEAQRLLLQAQSIELRKQKKKQLRAARSAAKKAPKGPRKK